MRPLLALLYTAAFSLTAWGEGLPVDEHGKIALPYSAIELTPSQTEEMEVLDSITLTPEQWTKLRKVSPNTPKRIEGILPSTYNDCTCMTPWGGIRLPDGQVAILHDEQTPDSISWQIQPGRHLTIHIDRRGQCYLRGTLVRFPVLLEAIRTSKAVPDYGPYGSWDQMAEVKLPLGMTSADPVFEDRIVKIYRELAAKNWNNGKVPEHITQAN